MLPLIHTTMPLDGAQRTVAEQGVLQWLEPLHIRQGGYLRLLDHYNGELDSDAGMDALFAKVRGSLPAVLAATGDETYTKRSTRGKDYWTDCEIEVIVFSNIRRSREAQNIGDERGLNVATVDPGCYVILNDVFTKLTTRWSGDARMERYRPTFTKVVKQLPDMTMWRIRFMVKWTLTVLTDSELADAPAITAVEHRHNLEDDISAPPPSINPVAKGLAQ